jgi:hypothetical protein
MSAMTFHGNMSVIEYTESNTPFVGMDFDTFEGWIKYCERQFTPLTDEIGKLEIGLKNADDELRVSWEASKGKTWEDLKEFMLRKTDKYC